MKFYIKGKGNFKEKEEKKEKEHETKILNRFSSTEPGASAELIGR